MEGVKIERAAQVKEQISRRYAGDKLHVVVLRDNKRQEFDVELIAKLEPSYRGELEITTLLESYLAEGLLDVQRMGRGYAWLERFADGIPARGVVERARYMGHESLVELRMEHDGSILKATVPSVFLPRTGTALWVMFRRERCFVFPADRTVRRD